MIFVEERCDVQSMGTDNFGWVSCSESMRVLGGYFLHIASPSNTSALNTVNNPDMETPDAAFWRPGGCVDGTGVGMAVAIAPDDKVVVPLPYGTVR